MIPPSVGRETLFAWYPPAHEQFAKNPHKTMAILDDYTYFKTDKRASPHDSGNDQESTVLSSKLNAIRQDLTRRRIDPSMIRQCQSKKFENINEYMNIPSTWKPIYPEPNLEIHKISSAPILKTSLPESKPQTSNQVNEKSIHRSKVEHQLLNSTENEIVKNPLVDKVNSSRTQRPHTAPGNLSTIQKTIPVQPKPVRQRLTSANGIYKDSNSRKHSQCNVLNNVRSQSCNAAARYEADLAKYKWLMEIPGDPFELKQPHIPEKQSYVRKIEEIKILPPELVMTKQNRNTFFYNTQPSQAISFDISPNFTSERYNAQKNKLKDQGKWNYSSKSFAFVY